MMCNGCSSNNNGPRYIALSCRKGYPKNGVYINIKINSNLFKIKGYVDLCNLCFEKIK